MWPLADGERGTRPNHEHILRITPCNSRATWLTQQALIFARYALARIAAMVAAGATPNESSLLLNQTQQATGHEHDLAHLAGDMLRDAGVKTLMSFAPNASPRSTAIRAKRIECIGEAYDLASCAVRKFHPLG